jgi:hypothetical protein
MSGDRSVLSRLRELIAALDRRAPHLERAGERRIARDAAHLKALAEERISQIEAPGGDGPAKGVMTCPSCQTPHPVPADDASATDSDWQCVRCGQRWSPGRLATVAQYAAWLSARQPAPSVSA